MSSSPHEFLIASAAPPPTAPARVRVAVFSDSAAAGASVARLVADLVRRRASEGKAAVLGLATGSTPLGVYDELVRLHREGGLSLRNVVAFNLDEYWPMRPEALQSYHRFMAENLFDHVDIDPAHVHIPDGTVTLEQVPAACEAYERRIREAGGIDLQLLGIGRTGHIGFNEPGSPRDSRTRLITLDKVTRMDAAADFFGEANVPRRAITMGVGTILEARSIVLLALGEGKARIVREAVEGPVTPAVAASFLQQHADARFVLDEAAAGELKPVKTPWLLGPLAEQGLAWDEALTRRAVIWLARRLDKPILKLVNEDYNEHGLQELLSARGSAYDVNLSVFNALRHTISGWPGGKAGRPRRDGLPDVVPKRIVVFSPHPDDDVISMGGTLMRLCRQGHEVHVAYQTSGNIAVFDEKAMRHADFVAEFARAFGLLGEAEVRRIEEAVERFVASKQPGEIDSPELQQIKRLIRRSEARAAARYCGVAAERVHFLDMPFYETGRVRKRPLADADVRLIAELLERVRPQQVYAAGDLSDPHGTHRVCLAAVSAALRELARRGAAWLPDCETWLYRGAWQEWEPHQIELAVPLSPDEVERKRTAIFFHESQKDKALFPGPWDAREFWKRAEDRNRETAELFDKLGLPEYQALEAFVRLRVT
ncbi:MAG: glucosamine-6-phosphate deaminase [Phycisphaerae bacterium]|nr:glucosamine-6-phosphate deaminase [Phycisphaerae bacterium]MCZ2399169.1 glucosamine-6-phosphate deaminase [Phycisphaerae bacterium]NUQ49982.1 glucosamine-6-phosphate deaminase [Phycisphaerae bacterium]